MLPELGEIKQRRKLLGLTQHQLAAESGVSQSLIAKMESGTVVPSYGNAKHIFDCLEAMHEKSGLTAKDIMTRKVITVGEEDSLKKAVKLLEENALSQLPVTIGGKSIGVVSEKAIVAMLGNSIESIDLGKLKVKDAMEDSLPTVQELTPYSVIAQLLNYNLGVLVKKHGKITGIITKSDLLKSMLK